MAFERERNGARRNEQETLSGPLMVSTRVEREPMKSDAEWFEMESITINSNVARKKKKKTKRRRDTSPSQVLLRVRSSITGAYHLHRVRIGIKSMASTLTSPPPTPLPLHDIATYRLRRRGWFTRWFMPLLADVTPHRTCKHQIQFR